MPVSWCGASPEQSPGYFWLCPTRGNPGPRGLGTVLRTEEYFQDNAHAVGLQSDHHDIHVCLDAPVGCPERTTITPIAFESTLLNERG